MKILSIGMKKSIDALMLSLNESGMLILVSIRKRTMVSLEHVLENFRRSGVVRVRSSPSFFQKAVISRRGGSPHK